MSIGGEIMSGDKVIVSDSMVDGRDGSKIRTNDPAWACSVNLRSKAEKSNYGATSLHENINKLKC